MRCRPEEPHQRYERRFLQSFLELSAKVEKSIWLKCLFISCSLFLCFKEKEYFNEKICPNKNNTGAIWKTIRRALPRKSSCTTHYTKDPSILGNEFNQFFISVGVNAAGKSAELARSLGLTDYLPSCSNNSPKSGEGLFDFKPVSCSEVREVLTVMPSNKAPGYDRIPPFVIKDCLSIILPTLTRLINSSLACSEFPRLGKCL